MHFRIRSAEGGLVTCDSYVVGFFHSSNAMGIAKWSTSRENRGLHKVEPKLKRKRRLQSLLRH